MRFSEQELVVFSNEYGYSFSVSRKTSDGEWQKTYMPISFRKGTVIPNCTKILIKDAWLSFYTNKSGKDVVYVFCNEYEILHQY